MVVKAEQERSLPRFAFALVPESSAVRSWWSKTSITVEKALHDGPVIRTRGSTVAVKHTIEYGLSIC